jgi:hypothetical protein
MLTMSDLWNSAAFSGIETCSFIMAGEGRTCEDRLQAYSSGHDWHTGRTIQLLPSHLSAATNRQLALPLRKAAIMQGSRACMSACMMHIRRSFQMVITAEHG